MPILTADKIAKSFRMEPVLEDVNLGIEWSERVGVIGMNGSGKSTLLRILAGLESPDSGTVALAREARVAYLSQRPEFPAGQTILDAVFAGSDEKVALLRDYERACRRLAAAPRDEGRMQKVAELADRLEAGGAWELETRARTVLTSLGLDDVEAVVDELSGGQRKLVALAAALVTEPDLLLLDEPTNHLDIAHITWLESYLSSARCAVLLVTHDRYFLERLVTRMLEVERGQVRSYSGSYSDYLEQKELLQAQREREARRKEVHLRQELEWLRRGPRARSTKQKARLSRAYELMDTEREDPARELNLATGSARLGKKILEAEGLCKSYDGNAVVRDFSLELNRGDRVGLLGPNGSGKTTLLELLTGRLAPDRGRLELGQTVVVGYFDQESRALDDESRMIDYIARVSDRIKLADGSELSAAQMLERFLFPGPTHGTLIEKLSGGERRRLELLRVLMGKPNLLVFDEPTNDLDIPTLTRLEAYLDDFPGCVLVVSHDRFFLDRVVNRLLHFQGQGRIREYIGGYSDVVDLLEEIPREREPSAAPLREPPPPSSGKKKASYKEVREHQQLEERIAATEERLKELTALLAEHACDYQKAAELSAELEQLEARLDQDLTRWAELEEVVAG